MTPNCSFPPSDTQIATHISKCLTDVSKWTTANHLKLNLNTAELLFMPGKNCPQLDLLVTIEDIKVSPSPTARNHDVVLDDQLCCNANITS